MNKPERIEPSSPTIEAEMRALGAGAKAAARELALASTGAKNTALRVAAQTLRSKASAILDANARDLSAAKAKGVSGAFLDRLLLDERRVEATAKGLEEIAELADPVGTVLAEWERPNNLKIARVRVPLGVIGIIYESRPN